jgi:hypothetical protein
MEIEKATRIRLGGSFHVRSLEGYVFVLRKPRAKKSGLSGLARSSEHGHGKLARCAGQRWRKRTFDVPAHGVQLCIENA